MSKIYNWGKIRIYFPPNSRSTAPLRRLFMSKCYFPPSLRCGAAMCRPRTHRSEGMAWLRIPERKLVLGLFPGKQTGKDRKGGGYRTRSGGAYMKIVLKQCIHKVLTYIREYVKYTFKSLGLIFCFQPGLIFCFRPGLIF